MQCKKWPLGVRVDKSKEGLFFFMVTVKTVDYQFKKAIYKPVFLCFPRMKMVDIHKNDSVGTLWSYSITWIFF